MRSLLAPIVFFDFFDYPLTATEIWQCQWTSEERHSFVDVQRALKALVEEKKIEQGDGFYFLPGRQALIKIRNHRHVIAYRKWHKALRVIRLLRFFPYIRMVGVANTLAYDNADEGSDVDLFIVTTKGRAWTARFFVVLFLQLFGLRPTTKTRRDKICACFFVDEEHLDISNLSLSDLSPKTYHPRPIPDIYLHYWIATLWPFYNPYGVYEKFFEANAWARKNTPNIHRIVPNIFRHAEAIPRLQRIAEWKARIFSETFYRRLQERRFPDAIRTRLGENTSVIANEHVLKFHTHDRREEYRRNFLEVMKKYAPRH